MNGKIYFNTVEDLSDFLKSFVGSTAKFECKCIGGVWELEFTGVLINLVEIIVLNAIPNEKSLGIFSTFMCLIFGQYKTSFFD